MISTAPQRLLFVDDEPRVLAGLRRLLLPRADEWEMSFVSSGADALEAMKRCRYDVLVCDVRMPAMSGEELLARVSEEHPGTVRIILSGQVDAHALMATINLTHQYLSKPCDPVALEEALVRALELRRFLESDALRALASRIPGLPSLPWLYRELVEALARDASLAEIGAIVARDVGMTAKILQIVNSAFFGMRCPVESPEQAVAVLGLRHLQSLVLTYGVFRNEGLPRESERFMEALWDHSVLVGSEAARRARELGATELEEHHALTAGLLHRVGQVVFHLADAPGHLALLRRARRRGTELAQEERSLFGVSHPEAGGFLLGLWGLPHATVDAIRRQQRPPGAGDPRPLRALMDAIAACPAPEEATG